VTYLFDNNISFRFAQALRALGVDVYAVREIDEPGESADDVDILTWLIGRDRVFVSGDRHIRTRPLEVAALRQSGVTALFLSPFWSKLEFWPQAAWLVKQWPNVEKFAGSASLGTCARIQQNGRIEPL
jgi:hypothetical protein